ncbi:cupin domain-containing protein [Oricola cellulosilytica]|uniref:Cupin domain-containing protein n=1 Tax=Oricola cellulosilytica TaxID=1429082 RepID=A0A4R0PEW6_9HYPH|nr:cupin domain-containing protein [Oricola cellulosilytica]TCD14925.1 cupin domain-containing protein [Oricola cellulosilytica]
MSDVARDEVVPRGYFRGPGEAELRWSGETRTHFLATGETTGGAFCLIDETARRGETVPLHRHPRDLESIYVVDGELSLFLNHAPARRAAAGAFAHFPAGSIHGFRVESGTARYLLYTTPHHGEFYRAISRPPGPGGTPATEPIDDAMIDEACRRFDIELIGPLPDAET